MSWVTLVVSIIGLITQVLKEYFSQEARDREEQKLFNDQNERFLFAINEAIKKNKEYNKTETQAVQKAEDEIDKLLKGKK